jgi:thiol-disulfide isomerase/thioredoxin
VFTCNTCPFSIAYEPILIDMAKHYEDQDVQFVLINSNDPVVKPGDSFDAMVACAAEKKYPFPYLFDDTQKVAESFGAKVTPHIFLVDSKQVLRYRGRINDNRDPEEVESHDLMQAIDALLAGKEIEVTDTAAFGCGIKWKKASS